MQLLGLLRQVSFRFCGQVSIHIRKEDGGTEFS